MTTDGSSFADTQAENPTNADAASRLSVTPNAGGGGNSHDGSAKDRASHNHPGGEPASASAEVPRSSEVSLAITLGASGASPSTPAQQILDGIERAIPAADNSQALTSALQPTLDGQQPLKTITVALSPASLGNCRRGAFAQRRTTRCKAASSGGRHGPVAAPGWFSRKALGIGRLHCPKPIHPSLAAAQSAAPGTGTGDAKWAKFLQPVQFERERTGARKFTKPQGATNGSKCRSEARIWAD